MWNLHSISGFNSANIYYCRVGVTGGSGDGVWVDGNGDDGYVEEDGGDDDDGNGDDGNPVDDVHGDGVVHGGQVDGNDTVVRVYGVVFSHTGHVTQNGGVVGTVVVVDGSQAELQLQLQWNTGESDVALIASCNKTTDVTMMKNFILTETRCFSP